MKKEDLNTLGVITNNGDESIFKADYNSSNIAEEEGSSDKDLFEFKENKPETLTLANKYELWKSDPNPKTFKPVLEAIEPTIRYALASNNSLGDSLIETKAKVLAAKAIKKFDPSYGVGLPTYVSSQLQKLSRVIRDSRNPIKIPERKLFAAAELAKSENEFKEKYNREPSTQELADFSGIPIKTIANVRKNFVKQVSEGNYYTTDSADDSVGSVSEEGKESADFTEEAMNYVYHNLAPRDQKIMEYSTGFLGSDKLETKHIAKKLNISQSQISRILAKIANDVYDVTLTLDKVYNK